MGSYIQSSDSSLDCTYYSEEKESDKNSMEKITEQEEDSPKNPKIMLNFKTLKKVSTLNIDGEQM